MATQVQARDAMQFINEQDAATLERFIERLEFRGKDPTFTAYRDAYLELIDLPRAGGGPRPRLRHRRRDARDRGARGLRRHGDRGRPEPGVPRRRRAARRGRRRRRPRRVRPRRRARARPSRRELRRRRGPHARQPRPRPARGARRGRARDAPGRMRWPIFDGDYASLTFGCSDARLGQAMEARGPVDDHELAAGHARAPAPAAAGRAPADRDAGPRVRGGRVEPLHAQPGRDLRAAGGLDRPGARRGRRRVARRPAPLRARTARSSRPATTTPTWRIGAA